MASKKEIYAQYGLTLNNGKLYNEYLNAFIAPPLVNGNAKLGKGVWTFSTLPGTALYTFTFNGQEYNEKGTCPCDCVGCYAKSGFYNMPSVIVSNGIKTMLSRFDREWLKRAIIAQIAADAIQFVRIHASGDFFSAGYIEMWKDVVAACPSCTFWSYTKNAAAESAFDSFANCNIVKSIVEGIGLNFGHCDYIMSTYETLQKRGESVYICRCGVDANQHCNNCKGCSRNAYVLFIEHSTSYNAKADSNYNLLKSLIEAQAAQ